MQSNIIILLSINKETFPDDKTSSSKVFDKISDSFSIKIQIFSFKVKLMVYNDKNLIFLYI